MHSTGTCPYTTSGCCATALCSKPCSGSHTSLSTQHCDRAVVPMFRWLLPTAAGMHGQSWGPVASWPPTPTALGHVHWGLGGLGAWCVVAFPPRNRGKEHLFPPPLIGKQRLGPRMLSQADCGLWGAEAEARVGGRRLRGKGMSGGT